MKFAIFFIPATILLLATVAGAQAQPLTITTQSLPSATVNSSYSTTLTASGGTKPYTWTIRGGTLPPGLNLNSSTGVISGTPTVIAQTNGFSFTVAVLDSKGQSASQTFSLQVFGVPTLTVSPTTLNLTAKAGATSQSQSLHIQVNTIDVIDVKVDTSYQKGNGWLSAGGSGSSLDYVVSADANGLPPDSYTATLTIACLGQTCNQSPAQVKVNLTVTTGTLSVTPAALGPFQVAAGATSTAQNIMVSSTGGTLQFTTNANSWIKVSPASGTATTSPQSLSVTVNAASLPAGPNNGTITFSCTGAVNCPFVVVTVTATVTPNTSGPSIAASGIRTASDFGFFQSATPGTFIEIYGSNLSTTTPGRPWDNDFKGTTAPTSLDNTSVTIDGRKAFVQYVSPGQVNALLPSDVGTGQVQVTLANTAGTSNSYTLTVNQVQPGLFAPASFKIGDKQYVAAFVGPDYRSTFALPTGAIPGRPSRPARQGETLVIYAMGLGPVSPSILAGTLFSGATNLTLPLEISFGNTAANVVYKGLAPGFTGLYQLNVEVPQVPDNDAVPLTLKLNGVPGTQTLYIAVHK